ncbi:hypothetical protein, partial [Algoriphagus sp.]|uniref:hypothetical protein n=1 Tax=Algoriphagus sp. TaxID=1872435 RepID=UPI00262ACB96
ISSRLNLPIRAVDRIHIKSKNNPLCRKPFLPANAPRWGKPDLIISPNEALYSLKANSRKIR